MSSLESFWRPLGHTGLRVSPLGFGTVKLGRDQGVKYPDQFQIPDDRQAAQLLALAQDLGINLLDTAPAYGRSEERLGQLLRGQRDQWVIVSKVGEEFEQGQSHFDFSAQHTRYSVERSLRRLNTDRLELVLVHSDGRDLEILEQTEVYPTLEALKREGKILAYGFSGKTPAGGLRALERGDCVMLTYNLNEQQEVVVIEQAARQGKAVLIKKALASGHACLDTTDDPVRRSWELLLRQPGISSIIVGTINPQHLRENVAQALAVLEQQI